MDILKRANDLMGAAGIEKIVSGNYNDSTQKYAEGGPVNTYQPTPQDIDYVARTMYGEAGNEPEMGIYGVGHVINNRFKQGNYKSYKDVVLAKNQFEAWTKGYSQRLTPNNPKYKQFYDMASQILTGQNPDPTNGALYFYNPALASPAWGKTFKETATIGGHRFMHNDPNWSTKGYEPRYEAVSDLFAPRTNKMEAVSDIFK